MKVDQWENPDFFEQFERKGDYPEFTDGFDREGRPSKWTGKSIIFVKADIQLCYYFLVSC